MGAPDSEHVTSRIRTLQRAAVFLLADCLKELVEAANPLADDGTLYGDLMNAAISEVDWHELAETFLEPDAAEDACREE